MEVGAKLNACPFCGGHARIFRINGLYSIECNLCGNRTIDYGKFESALAVWNRRYQDVKV